MMTSEREPSSQTNEFLRRRKLRLQQVREQSKDIAKKLRQRAIKEKSQHIDELKNKQEKEYLKHQAKLVKRLEQLYAQGVKSVGASHNQASVIQENASKANYKEDLSKLRGKEAASELRRIKQDKLDQHKKILDRRLLARETANELSREKVSSVANKIAKATSNHQLEGADNRAAKEVLQNGSGNTRNIQVKKNDMATQCDSEEVTNEWEPNVPELSLPKDDRDSLKESNNIPESRSDRSKRLDLFALSSEMPSSLRGGLSNVSQERTNIRPSLTMVSEYLQSRALRLRENVPVKKHVVEDNLHSLKRTIQHMRSSKVEGTSNDVCHVLDEQIIPVPSWHAESSCEFCSHHISRHNNNHNFKQFTVTNSEINQIFSSIRPRHADFQPTPVLRGSSPFRRNKSFQRTHTYSAQRKIDKSIEPTDVELLLNRKPSVTIYNHSTRNSKDIAYGDPGLVVRETLTEGDAYANAMKEMSINNSKEKEHLKKLQEMRSKVAITKQNVEKEYKDTMSLLKSLPKDKCSKHARMSHMDEKRQQMQKDRHQLKLQRDFNKIDRETRKMAELTPKCKVTPCNKKQSKSPVEEELNDGFESRDLQYSWMPVPESDGNLAIHTIPTTLKEGKSGNTVKFSKVDSYHEYRSRHKHTPPTKDTNKDKNIETIHLQNDDSVTSDNSSSSSDTSSVENLNLQKKKVTKQKPSNSEEENVVIYKILNSKKNKKEKERERLKLIDDVAKVLNAMNKEKVSSSNKDDNNNKDSDTGVPIEQINEGVYKVVNEKGDNITSLYFPENTKENTNTEIQKHSGSCLRRNKNNKNHQFVDDAGLQSGYGEESVPRSTKSVESRESFLKSKYGDIPGPHPSAATSTSSFKTAAMNEKSATLGSDIIKLLDDNGQEAGKFYIGASGFLSEDAYEITIQLKKKESIVAKEKSRCVKPDETAAKKHNSPLMETKNVDELSAPIPNSTEPLPNSVETTNTMGFDKTDLNKHPDTESVPDASKVLQLHSTDLEDIVTNTEVKTSEKCVDEPPMNLSKEKMENTCKKYVDVGVYTTSQLSSDVPRDYTKSDIPPRPATSTYTQTTNSPSSRPVYIHMSSSTSTAYMSPPETILPKCLRQYYIDSRRDQNSMCLCQQCLLYKKITVNNAKTITKSNTKSKNDISNASTPPNTGRYNLSNNLEYDCHLKSSSRKRNKCRKCHSRLTSSTDFNLNTKLKRSKKLSYNICTMRSTSNATNSNISDKVLKSDLNPIVKKYINKLLELNSNGLKAIEIANQECSSVSTPGSSIIDVSNNINNKTTDVNNKISLEQIKLLLKQKILEECVKDKTELKNMSYINHNKTNSSAKASKSRRSVHKIKSLNISKKILRPKKSNNVLYSTDRTHSNKPSCSTSSPSSTGIMHTKLSVLSDLKATSIRSNKKNRSRSSPTPRYASKFESTNDNTCSDISDNHKQRTKNEPNKCFVKNLIKPVQKVTEYILPHHKATFTAPNSEDFQPRREFPANTSTQTSQDVDGEINLIKMAEDKIQNMEKIADLTEKCTKRLSNLAKILEEVRKNKSAAYSHISTSDTASDNEQKSDNGNNIGVTQHTNPVVAVPKESSYTSLTGNEVDSRTNPEYISILKDIPKPDEYKLSNEQSTTQFDLESPKTPENNVLSKTRTRPPPALSRKTLKHGQDIIPHELSTVVEVDSPMSVQLKNQSSKGDIQDTTNLLNSNGQKNTLDQIVRIESKVNPDLLQNSNSLAKTNNGLPDDSKIQMMDLKQFNDVMLKPFISLQEYAKQCNVGILDEGSNMDDNVKDDLVNEELSSLHSDGSLPDVIAELLKRNIIAEPFKFDTVSNVNSTTVSSESTLSVIALSKVRNNKKKPSVAFQNKENISETSDTLSFSSNPDLENAFKKLGMGWASSTLKKTKERLALSSSTNTSSSSLSQFKTNHISGQEIPVLVTDSVLSVSKTNKRKNQGKDSLDKAKNAEQQTSFMTSMTVKEFLTNELAKKITFTNKSHRNESGEEFVSLLETKIPEEMKHTSLNLREEHSMDSLPSGSNNRARTSTPVQIFKSMTYHSSSSSNISNGLFSNADDLSSVKVTSNSMHNHSNSDKGDLTIPNCSLKVRKGASDSSKSD